MIGNAFTHPNSFKSAHFHSITGKPAIPQMFPKPKTAEPSEITATVFHFNV
jgi:hypothetical protein